MSSNKSKLLSLIVAVLLVGGGVFLLVSMDDSEEDVDTSTQVVQVSSDQLPFSLTVDNLAPLADGVYEGWVVRGDDKMSFGRFNTTDSGEIDGELAYDGALEDGDTVAISVEPTQDPDPEPSETIILAGGVMNGAAELTFPVDVSEFSGQYILATPTTETTDDETAGLWFTITGSDASLNIPVAPAGWAYEGWAVVDGQPLSSGLFTNPAEADFFGGYSGPAGSPNKPGEDFITNLPNGLEGPLDLRGSTIVVSLEPYQNGEDPTGPMPAQVKPLTSNVAEEAIDHSAFDLVLGTDTIPAGSVSQ